MNTKNDLTSGPILKKMILLALPIIGTSFFQMAYNLTDLFWIGKLSSGALAAVGTAGFYPWFAMAFIMLSKIGAEVGVAQSVGKKDIKSTHAYVGHTIKLNVIMSIMYSVIVFLMSHQLIAIFNLGDSNVIKMAESYLKIISFGLPFYFVNPVLTGIFNGSGDSKTPFWINSMGLLANIILDPLLIFGFKLGVRGAAFATISAQIIVTMLFLLSLKKHIHLFEGFSLRNKLEIDMISKIIKLGFPVGIQNACFTIIAMMIARIITNWGATPIAVQKVGSQIEALSWMTASGIATALGTFVGQNYGAKQSDRIIKAYKIAIILMVGIGSLVTCLFVFFGKELFSIFTNDISALEEGAIYMKILGYSQLFMCIEITTSGFFNGLGKTHIPSINSITLTAMRIPMAYVLSATALELSGVWWSITITSIAKGIIMLGFVAMLISNIKKNGLDVLEKVSHSKSL